MAEKCCTFFLLACLLLFGSSEAFATVQNTPSISIAHVESQTGNVVDVPVTADAFGNITIFECRIGFLTDVLEFQGIVNIYPGIANMLSNHINNTIMINWIGIPAVNIPNGTVLFKLRFHFCNELLTCALNGTESSIFLLENYAFITNESFQQIPLQLNHGSVFAPVPLRVLAVDQTGAGQVFVNGNPYTEPIIVDNDTGFVLQAIPAEGYLFQNWTNPDGMEVSDQPEYSFTMPDHHLFLTANFTEMPNEVYVLTFFLNNEFSDPVDDAVVVLNEIEHEPGHYVFEGLMPGQYNFVIAHPCYHNMQSVVTIVDSDINHDVEMQSIPGDANGDGVVNVLDIIAIGNYYANHQSYLNCFYNADVNQDGAVNVLDIIGIVNIVAGSTISND